MDLVQLKFKSRLVTCHHHATNLNQCCLSCKPIGTLQTITCGWHCFKFWLFFKELHLKILPTKLVIILCWGPNLLTHGQNFYGVCWLRHILWCLTLEFHMDVFFMFSLILSHVRAWYLTRQQAFNSLRQSDPYIRQETRLSIISSDNGLSPVRLSQCWLLVQVNCSIEPLVTKFCQIQTKVYQCSFKKCISKCCLLSGSHFVLTCIC